MVFRVESRKVKKFEVIDLRAHSDDVDQSFRSDGDQCEAKRRRTVWISDRHPSRACLLAEQSCRRLEVWGVIAKSFGACDEVVADASLNGNE
jgi:hypothetical protein